MNSFLTQEEVSKIGFKSVGSNVLISNKVSFYGAKDMVIGDHVRIDDYCILSGEITLGSYIHISAYCALYGSHIIEMEDYTGLSARCTLISASDDFSGDFLIGTMVEESARNIIEGKILIKKYSQLGAGCIVFPKVTIEEGVAVGAMSLINKNLNSWGIYVGIPATKLKDRSNGLFRFINDSSHHVINSPKNAKEIYILGVGNNTPVIIELAELNGYHIKGLYHFEEGRTGEIIHGYPIIGSFEELFSKSNLESVNLALSMGNNKIRVEIAEKIRNMGGHIPTLIHPTASISKYATIEEGVVIQANSTIQADVIVKKDSIISFNVGISHNSIIEQGVYIACQTIIGAKTHIKEFVLVGMGVTVISNKVGIIGKSAKVGAGSVVTKSVEENSIILGNPARKIN